ncbi:TPA: phage tail protein [Enterobacter hormaechei subsp. xiangfangensis]|nr:phage tail protein [Enterobacter hormaechei subsp. xiangfangensis]
MADIPKNARGIFDTHGLGPKQFNKVFQQIQREQRAKRRKAKRTLTPSVLRNKKLEDVLKLGSKVKGGTVNFTLEDLKGFEQSRDALKKAFKSKERGITYSQLISHCRSVDVQRANNKGIALKDGSGITSATFIGLQHNMARVSVKASNASKHGHHRVRVRFEGWQDALDDLEDTPESEKAIAKKLCAGPVSFDCDCGRHQYWYRYIATAGNFGVTPPAEYAYPKIRNPRLEGVACKHVIHAMTRFQSGAWQKLIGKYLQKNAKAIGFGDDRKRTVHFTEEELKQANRNRASQTDLARIKSEYAKFVASQQAINKKIAKPSKTVQQLRNQLKKQRQITNTEKERRQQAEKALKERQRQLDEAKKQVKDAMAMRKQGFIDAMLMAGKTRAEAEKMFTATLNNAAKGK